MSCGEQPGFFDAPTLTAPPTEVTPARSSRSAHLERMHSAAVEALRPLVGTPERAREVIAVLQHVEPGFCAVCGYKRKAATGDVAEPDELSHIDGLASVAINRQRDGDDGDLRRRWRNELKVLHALFHAEKGLTDEEMTRRTGIFHDTAKASRSGLVTGGWVRATGETRLSQNRRPMRVWVLTDRALAELEKLRA